MVVRANWVSFHDDAEHWIAPYRCCSAMMLVNIVGYLRHTATYLVNSECVVVFMCLCVCVCVCVYLIGAIPL